MMKLVRSTESNEEENEMTLTQFCQLAKKQNKDDYVSRNTSNTMQTGSEQAIKAQSNAEIQNHSLAQSQMSHFRSRVVTGGQVRLQEIASARSSKNSFKTREWGGGGGG